MVVEVERTFYFLEPRREHVALVGQGAGAALEGEGEAGVGRDEGDGVTGDGGAFREIRGGGERDGLGRRRGGRGGGESRRGRRVEANPLDCVVQS